MFETENGGNRKRASSLRTQMFNKHLFDKITSKHDSTDPPANDNEIELNEFENDDNSTINKNPGQNHDPGMFDIIEEPFEDEDGLTDLGHEDNLEENQTTRPNIFIRALDLFLDRHRTLHTKDGRHIPVTLDHSLAEYGKYTNGKSDLLIDERTNKPYCKNTITSSRYTIYSFFPKQIYAQFSKVANIYFFVIAILQMIPGWSTTGTYTTIIPLLVFMGISMAREAWDDFRRHRLDNDENGRKTKILIKDSELTEKLGSQQDDLEGILNDVNNQFEPPSGETIIPKTHFTNLKLLASNHNVHMVDTQWKDLKVGDFVTLRQDEWVPADLLLLTSDGENNEVFVETMALDGETNLKNRQPHMELNKLTCSASGLANINANVTVEDPNNDLYNFEGNLELQDTQNNTFKKFPIGLDNVIYRGSIIRNTPRMVGMVIFTGEETKIRMNAIRNPRTKAPKLQKSINLIIAFMVFVVACVSFFSYLGNVIAKRSSINGNKAWYLFEQDAGVAPTIMSFIIMFNTMIPLSLYVTMEIIKVAQSKLMEWDIDMYDEKTDTPCESRTATILEELGQVSYIFSDKTGTLTDNKMIFRKFSFLGSSWLHDMKDSSTKSKETLEAVTNDNDIDTISLNPPSVLNQHFDITKSRTSMPNSNEPRPSIDYKGNAAAVYVGRPSMSSLYMNQRQHQQVQTQNRFSGYSASSQESNSPENIKSSYDLIRFIQEYPNKLFSRKAKFFILSMALCHACLPKKVTGHEDDDDAIEYQSSSPDELALITAARDLGCVVINKNAQTLTIKTYPDGFDEEPKLEDYEILNTIDFNSQRKRMSVVVRMPDEPSRVLLICKGADNVILERLHNSDIAFQKMDEINNTVADRKEEEAELVVQQRKSLERMTYDDTLGRNSLRGATPNDARASLSLQAMRKSISQRAARGDSEVQLDSIDDILDDVKRNGREVDDVIMRSRKSLHKQQVEKYRPNNVRKIRDNKNNAYSTDKIYEEIGYDDEDILDYIGDENLLENEEYVIERTVQAIDDFSTDGLRTLLFGYKWIDLDTYESWNKRYHKAKTSLVHRKEKTNEVGGDIENNLTILGATAIEDKLQDGVTEAIEKIKRAGIKMWMLTGDKRETAINIGYSCKLIYDYSTVVILTTDDANIVSKMNAISQEISAGNMAHCVIVIDGATLGSFESNPTLMSVFVELCTKTDSVICCRSSPSQKAIMVSNIRNANKNEVTLAIGDGANDIAMIQAADIGVGITGKEGLQASRSSDYSIAQFRFLLKLLLVHGRYNYIRTANFVLCTFYKELTFYMTQVIFQRFTLFSGSSLYEPWSLSMFNTLFTSLPVLCIGIFEKDLKPITLLTVPELYSFGRLGEGFSLWIFLEWMIEGACNSVIITLLNVVMWGETALSDSTMYPLGVVNFTAIVVLINIKAQFLEMHNKSWVAFVSVILSAGGWLVWCCALPILNRTDGIYDVIYGFYYHFGKDITFWCTCLALTVLPITIDIVYQTLKTALWPTDADIFAELEKKSSIRKKLELGAYNEMKQGWTWEQDPSSIQRYKSQIFSSKKSSKTRTRASSTVSDVRDVSIDLPNSPASEPSTHTESTWSNMVGKMMPGGDEDNSSIYDPNVYETLPSGKVVKKEDLIDEDEVSIMINLKENKTSEPNHSSNSDNITSKIGKKLRFKSNEETDEDVMEIIRERMKDLE
ncbi:probable phospholipid-transporting ATPase Dnf3p [Monosporozyma unispora]